MKFTIDSLLFSFLLCIILHSLPHPPSAALVSDEPFCIRFVYHQQFLPRAWHMVHDCPLQCRPNLISGMPHLPRHQSSRPWLVSLSSLTLFPTRISKLLLHMSTDGGRRSFEHDESVHDHLDHLRR